MEPNRVGGTESISLDAESENALLDEHARDHLVLWYRSDEGRTRTIAKFLSPGVRSRSLLVLVLPLRELQQTESLLRKQRFPIDRLLKEGRLLLFSSEEFLPGKSCECGKLRQALAELHARAKEDGQRIRLAGRIAPILMERGDARAAMMVEKVADDSLENSRLLCLYDARKLGEISHENVRKINSAHTHSLVERGNGGVSLSRRGRQKASSRKGPKNR